MLIIPKPNVVSKTPINIFQSKSGDSSKNKLEYKYIKIADKEIIITGQVTSDA